MTDSETLHGAERFLRGEPAPLDLFSTSAKSAPRCIYNAPYLYVPGDGPTALLFQSCCNHWDCPRCGEKRAKYEYGRIIEGARTLAKQGHTLHMMTITCRGDVSLENAERQYLCWTKKYHDTIRARAKTQGDKPAWVYAAVLERQGRGHPHTHYITNFAPDDAFNILADYPRYRIEIKSLNAWLEASLRFAARKMDDIGEGDLHSTWLHRTAVGSGLGVQVAIAVIDSIEAASRYTAKYLFKNIKDESWPQHWKRVRYSQSWPKFAAGGTEGAFAIIKAGDWNQVINQGKKVQCFGLDVLKTALRHQVARAYCPMPDGTILSANDVEI